MQAAGDHARPWSSGRRPVDGDLQRFGCGTHRPPLLPGEPRGPQKRRNSLVAKADPSIFAPRADSSRRAGSGAVRSAKPGTPSTNVPFGRTGSRRQDDGAPGRTRRCRFRDQGRHVARRRVGMPVRRGSGAASAAGQRAWSAARRARQIDAAAADRAPRLGRIGRGGLRLRRGVGRAGETAFGTLERLAQRHRDGCW